MLKEIKKVLKMLLEHLGDFGWIASMLPPFRATRFSNTVALAMTNIPRMLTRSEVESGKLKNLGDGAVAASFIFTFIDSWQYSSEDPKLAWLVLGILSSTVFDISYKFSEKKDIGSKVTLDRKTFDNELKSESSESERESSRSVTTTEIDNLSSKEESNNSVTINVSKLEKRVKELEEERSKLGKNIETLEEKNKLLTTEKDSLVMSREASERKVTTLGEKNKELKEQNDCLVNQCNKYKKNQEEIETRVEEQNRTIPKGNI